MELYRQSFICLKHRDSFSLHFMFTTRIFGVHGDASFNTTPDLLMVVLNSVTYTLVRACSVLCTSACRGLGMSDVTETLCVITWSCCRRWEFCHGRICSRPSFQSVITYWHAHRTYAWKWLNYNYPRMSGQEITGTVMSWFRKGDRLSYRFTVLPFFVQPMRFFNFFVFLVFFCVRTVAVLCLWIMGLGDKLASQLQIWHQRNSTTNLT